MIAHSLWLLPLGFGVGAVGTLIGAGGGFLLVPILALAYRDMPPEALTSLSLAVVFFNTLSGSIAYARRKRIDYRSGVQFAAATVPGAILGALATACIPRRVFDGVLGALLVAAAGYLMARPPRAAAGPTPEDEGAYCPTFTDAAGKRYEYCYNRPLGIAISVGVGFLSSLLGIGGGIIHVPVLTGVLNFPVHVATATSHFVLSISALTGSLVHVAAGSFRHMGLDRLMYLSVGVLAGAPLGAYLSDRVRGAWILRGLALGLAAVGVRLAVSAFGM